MFIMDDNAVVSYGGGVNSTGLVIELVRCSWRGRVVMCDTGAEWPETTAFVRTFDLWLRQFDLSVEVIGGEWRTPSAACAVPEYCEQYGMIPLAARRWCTKEYKVLPMRRWCKAHGVRDQYLGISTDEAHRAPHAIRPLLDMGLSRGDCVRIIEAEGLSVPPRSKCWLCPFQTDSEWRKLWATHPELYARAEALEAQVQRKSEGRFTATLDPSGKVTLAQRREVYEKQGVMVLPDAGEGAGGKGEDE